MTLIEKLKAATGPDRELDAEVALHLTKPEGDGAYWSMPLREGPEACAPGTLWGKNRGFRSILEDAPEYTASIDAALALVAEKLPGWDWELCLDRGEYDFQLTSRRPELSCTYYAGFTKSSPAIAILIALLTALEGETT